MKTMCICLGFIFHLMCAIGVAGGNAYLHSGLYTFELGDADARTPVEARFSYVWRNVNGVWKISHHHSSVVPNFTPPVPDMLATARVSVVS